MTYILGISCFYHDSAACLVRDGEIVSAVQEERFTRKKHDESFPKHAIDYCLKESNIRLEDINLIAFYDNPFLKFERIIETYLSYAPKGLTSFLASMPVWMKEKFWMEGVIRKHLGYTGKIIFLNHHQAHAASAFFPSPFREAAFLTVDGVGESATASYGIGSGNSIAMKSEIRFPHSLGLLYSAFTYYLGFKVNSGEYKVMGLAPYGEPKYTELIYKHLIDLKEDGSFRMDMKYFEYPYGLTMTNDNFHRLFGGPPRSPETPLTQRDMDIARSIQDVTEHAMLLIATHVHKETKQKYLCLAGGVALNCVANGKILREGPFEDIWIQPAAGDAGGALGAAMFAWYQHLGNKRDATVSDSQKGSYLGPQYSEEEIRDFLEKSAAPYKRFEDSELFEHVASLLSAGKVVGWFQGRMEFGPRALGARSILGDPRSSGMQSIMNLKIKFRESFRPFAPSILEEMAGEYFDIDRASPYMLMTASVKESQRLSVTTLDAQSSGLERLQVVRSKIPAVTHVDYSARLQTVNAATNPRYHQLLKAFYAKTGCPLLVNTSFNVRSEPMVCTPEDAYTCFMRTGMDYLVLENFVLEKSMQPVFADIDGWQKEYEPD